jgi:DNA-binding transcriptional LysR family regulator
MVRFREKKIADRQFLSVSWCIIALTRPNLQELDAAMTRIRRAAKGSSQLIFVGTTPLVAANILPQAMKEFRSQRPDLRIQLFDADPTPIMRRVEAGELDLGLGVFESAPGVRRKPFFRFSLMVIRADKDGALHPTSTTWSALNGQTLISLRNQRLIDQHLKKAGVVWQRGLVVNLLDTQIALVEADEGMAIIPSFGLPVCRNRKVVVSRLINPVVNLDFDQISNRGKKLPPGADEFTAFLKTHIARWAGRAGIL